MALNGRRRTRRKQRGRTIESAWTNTDKELYPSKVRGEARWYWVVLDVITDILFYWWL